MKNLLKKLNNFRLASLIYAAIAILGVIVTLLFFVAYQTTSLSSDVLYAQKDMSVVSNAFPDREILGMIFFISAIVAVILGIAVVVLSFPYIMPKEKGTPSRAIGYVLAAQAIFVLILVVLGVVCIATSKRQTSILSPDRSAILHPVMETVLNKPFWIIDIVLGVIFVGGAGCMLLPTLKCDFYCPELVAGK